MTTYKYDLMGQPIVHDGDTVTVSIDLGFYLYHTLHIRMAGINAPELITPEGKAARAALVQYVMLQPAKGWTAQTYKSGNDKYGRWLATVFAPDGTSVNQWMLDNGYAVIFNG